MSGEVPEYFLRQNVDVALFQINFPWQLPAFLQFGGWNDSPEPVIQTAVSRYFWEIYNAEIASLGPDYVEYEVNCPHITDEEAMEIAWIHYLFCPDIVLQGAGTIAKHAANLIEENRWFFWWD